MTRIEELEALTLDALPQPGEELQKFFGGIIHELISVYRRVDYLTNRLYGRSTERYEDERQLKLNFPVVEEVQSNVPAVVEKEEITYQRKKRRGRNFEELPEFALTSDRENL